MSDEPSTQASDTSNLADRRRPYLNKQVRLEIDDGELLQCLKDARTKVMNALEVVKSAPGFETIGDLEISTQTLALAGQEETPVTLLATLILAQTARSVMKVCDSKLPLTDSVRKELMLSRFPGFGVLLDDAKMIQLEQGSTTNAGRIAQYVGAAKMIEDDAPMNSFTHAGTDPNVCGDEEGRALLEVNILDRDLASKVAEMIARRFIEIMNASNKQADKMVNTILTDTPSQDNVKAMKHQPLSPEQIHNIIGRVCIRLGGFNSSGQPVLLENDIDRLQRLESRFVEWIDCIEIGKRRKRSRRDKFNPIIRQQMQAFNEDGGHTSRYSNEQQEYIFRNGVVAFIEMQIRSRLVTIGAVTGLSSNPVTVPRDGRPRNKDSFHIMFPQFDLRDIMFQEEKTKNAVLAAAPFTFLTCRSSVLTKMSDPFILEQLEGEELPPELVGQELHRLGLAARAKAVLFLIACELGSKYATSNIGSLTHKGDRIGLENKPSTQFNDWMQLLGWRGHFKLMLDSEKQSGLAMLLKAFMGKIPIGLDALAGPHGIATGKGHDAGTIRKEASLGLLTLKRAIRAKEHHAWTSSP